MINLTPFITPREQLKRLFWPVTMIISILSVSLARASSLGGTDIFWSARNGGDILQSGQVQVFINDMWNVTALGEQWSPNSWLWNVLLHVSYSLLGTAGFVVLTFITNTAIFALVWVFMKQNQVPVAWQFFIMVGSWFVILPYTNGRSNTVDFLILAAFLVAAKKLSDSPHWLVKWGVVVVSFAFSVLWINFHLTGILAVVLFPMVVYGITKRYLLSAVAAGAALVALPLSPFGVEALLKVSTVQNASKGYFYEWSNVFSGGQINYAAALALIIALVFMIVLLRQKQFLYAFGVAVLAYIAYDMIRISPYLWLVMIAGISMIKLKAFTKFVWPAAVGVITVMVFGAGLVTGFKTVMDPETALPVDPSTFQDIPLNSIVASTNDAGNELILYRPDVLVTLDGRNDLLGKERYSESNNMFWEEDEQALEAWLSEYNIDAVFIPAGRGEKYSYDVIARNMESLGWNKIVRDNAVTFTK